MSTVADLIVRRFVAAGVRGLFGMPGGGSNLDLLEAAARADLPFVLAHTETAGALMASAQAEVTRAPGACLATLGPGVTSLANGVAHARLDRVPLVVVTDGLPVAVRRTYDHQTLDHAALLAPLVKRSVLVDPRDGGDAATEAIDAALAAPPGPVHLDCPSDVAAVGCERDPGLRTGAATRATPAGAAVDLPAGLLAGSRRPLLIAGLGVGTPSEATRLRALCARRGMPALVTYKAKGVVPDAHPSFAGVFTHAAPDEPFVRSADLILAVGLDPVELLPRPWTYPQPVVACGPWPSDGRHVPVAAQAAGDLDDLLAALDERLPAATAWHPSEIRRQADGQRQALRVEAAGFAPYRAVEAAARAAGPDARVTVDAGAHMFPVMALWPVNQPRQLLISNGLSTMGFALPAAIGAALLDRPQRVVALTGDGGLLVCLGELSTLARERLPVTVVVFSDRSLSLIRIKQERLGHRTDGSALGRIDWPALARSLGLESTRATDEADLERRLAETMTSEEPALIEATIDASAYPATLKAVRG
jgi:acetolactate synthase-1/2/3 large subunit